VINIQPTRRDNCACIDNKIWDRGSYSRGCKHFVKLWNWWNWFQLNWERQMPATGCVILAYSLTHAAKCGEKEWEHMSIIAYGSIRVFPTYAASPASPPPAPPFDFVLNGTLLCSERFRRSETDAITLWLWKRSSFCTVSSHCVEFISIIQQLTISNK